MGQTATVVPRIILVSVRSRGSARGGEELIIEARADKAWPEPDMAILTRRWPGLPSTRQITKWKLCAWDGRVWVTYLAVQSGIDLAVCVCVCVSFEGRRAEKRARKKERAVNALKRHSIRTDTDKHTHTLARTVRHRSLYTYMVWSK